jgi:tRNA(Ile)-lysidine synthase
MVIRNRLTPAVADVRRAVRNSLDALNLEPDSRVLVACSGGPDSMALAAALIFEGPKLGLRVSAVVVDHGLQEASSKVAQSTAAKLEELGVDPVVIETITVAESGNGPEAAARTARYEALERARKLVSAEVIFLGHNLEDQAETVLLGLTRGSGLRSIAGMQDFDKNKKLVRPLLGIKREVLLQSCIDQDIEAWQDPHNIDPKFTRVRIRQLLDTLESELGPGFASALARTAELASESDDVLLSMANELVAEATVSRSSNETKLSIARLTGALTGLRRRALFETAIATGAKTVSRSQVIGIDELITNWHGQNKLVLSGITVERVSQELVFKGV